MQSAPYGTGADFFLFWAFPFHVINLLFPAKSPRFRGGLPLFPHAASTFTPVGATTGQRGSAAGEMEPNGGKHRFLRSENRDEIEEVKQNAMSLV